MDLGVSHDAVGVRTPCLPIAILTPVNLFVIFAVAILVAAPAGPKLIALPSSKSASTLGEPSS
jgi:hypothetical protein